MNGMKFNFVQAFAQLVFPTIVDFVGRTLWPTPGPDNAARGKLRGINITFSSTV
jgi:hypothetical protein